MNKVSSTIVSLGIVPEVARGHERKTHDQLHSGDKSFHLPWMLGIFVLLCIHMLGFAQAILMPVALAFFFALVLQPLVRGLEKLRIPRGVGAAVVLMAVVSLFAVSSLQLAGPAREWFSDAPQRINKVEAKVRGFLQPFEQFRKAADGLANGAGNTGKQLVNVNDSFATDVLGRARTVLEHAVLVIILLFFLLSSGDHFWSGAWHLCSSRVDRNTFMTIIHNIETRLSTYLFTVTLINMGVGFFVGCGMFLIGMPNPVLWGALAACLNFVPYLGALVGEVIVGMVALFSFESAGHALLAPLIYFAVAFLEGNFVSPMILGRKFTVRPILIILSMIFFGWVWGTVGVFLAVPVLVLFGIVCENIPDLDHIGRFLRA